MNKRGFTILQAIASMVLLSIVILALTYLVSMIGTQKSTILNMQTMEVVNINAIEKLDHEVKSTGMLVPGEYSETVSYGFRKVNILTTIEATDSDSVYLVTVRSKITSASAATLKSAVVLSAGVFYE